jgi:hypothetical protein
MTTLPPANGRPQTLSFNKTREVQVGPRFEIQSTESSPPNWEPSSLNAQPAFTNQPEPEKPAPAKKRRRYNAFRDRRARVRDFRKMLPRKVPRRRDLDIYQTVVHDKLSQHLVAEIYGLSQTRISQIVREVRAWKATLPYEIPGMTEQQQINLATKRSSGCPGFATSAWNWQM